MELEIVSFTCYREYLRELIRAKQKVNPRFSFRKFSGVVGFKSPNYLQMIIDGRRNLTVATASLMAHKLKLSSGERDYFTSLVQMASAKNDADRNEAERARLVAVKKIVTKEIPAAQKEIFSKWYYLLVRELFLLPNAKSSPEWIMKMLSHCIDSEEAQSALAALVRCGFLQSENGKLKPAEPVLDTNDQLMQAAMLRVFHSDTLKAWAKNLDRLNPRDQELGVLNIPIDSKKLPELRERIRRFQDEIIGWVQDEKTPDRVVQLGTYLVPFDSESR